jgi:hypothetical protein
MTQKDMTPTSTVQKTTGMAQDASNGTTPMMQTFAQYNTPNQPEKNNQEKTEDELNNPQSGPTGAIRTKKDSILNQARQIYNTQLNNNQA